ncbi:MAG: TIM barrel protein [Candidatus Gastranaerophilales bacterium]|nr:TIM barrel protein [Candidatus Gastranaerophilales bacterium]
MDKLNFLTAGMPLITGNKGYAKALEILNDMDLDGLELEFVHGVRIKDDSKEILKKSNLVKTIHAPFYINLNSKEEEKIQSSIERILETARVADDINAFSITYHAGFYLGMDKDAVYKKIETQTKIISDTLKNEDVKVWIRPETTGKATQWGNLEEIISLSKDFDYVLPCVDFAHLHARYNGISNTYDEFCAIFDKIGNELGQNALDNFHAHIAGIAYSEKGEKHHLNLDESDFNYKDLLRAFKKFDVKGVIICESPNIETDCKILKNYYCSL